MEKKPLTKHSETLGEITTKAGVILQSDVGIEGRPRWFKVTAVGPKATDEKT